MSFVKRCVIVLLIGLFYISNNADSLLNWLVDKNFLFVKRNS